MRAFLLSVAALFLAWELHSTVRWLEESGGPGAAFGSLWSAFTSDRMLQLVVTDHLLIAAVALVLMVIDASRRTWPTARIAMLATAFVALGSPVLLAYLAGRRRT